MGDDEISCKIQPICNKRIVTMVRNSRSLVFRLFRFLILTGAVGTLALFYFSSGVIEDSNYGRIGTLNAESALHVRSNKSRIVLAKVCSNVTRACYTVSDSIDLGRQTFVRSLNQKDTEDEFETLVRLKVPEGVDVWESDTRIWDVDHLHLSVQYIATMLVAPFATSVLDFSKGKELKSRVALIGLGGGSLTMFLRKTFVNLRIVTVEVDPTVAELARKWFGVVNDTNHAIVIDDGVNYLKEATMKGKHFDALFVDACGSDSIMACPASIFLDDNLLTAISGKLLAPAGAFVLNVLPLRSEQTVVENVLRKLRRHFRTCVIMKLIEELNTIIVCLPNGAKYAGLSQKVLSGRLLQAWSNFKFNETFGGDDKFFVS